MEEFCVPFVVRGGGERRFPASSNAAPGFNLLGRAIGLRSGRPHTQVKGRRDRAREGREGGGGRGGGRAGDRARSVGHRGGERGGGETVGSCEIGGKKVK